VLLIRYCTYTQTVVRNWTYKQKAFWKHINIEDGEEYGADSKLINDVFARTGSYIVGNAYKADDYVLTHEKR
jgi:hypothetical protein